MQFRFPLDTINIKMLFNQQTHRGIDFGWFSDTPDEDIFAVADGVVVEVENNYNKTSPGSGHYGNYIKIRHDNNVYSLYAHCKYHCSVVNVGDKVLQHQKINTMGNTGDSNGPHCHFEIFEGNVKVNPLNYLRKYPDQNIFYNSILKDLPLYEEEKKLEYIGTPVERNKEVDQLNIFDEVLHVRSSANGDIIGYANKGIYNVNKIEYNGEYDWIEIEENKWVARDDRWNEFLKKEDKAENSEKEPQEEQNTENNTNTQDTNENPQNEPKNHKIWHDIINSIINILMSIIKLFKKD